MTEAYGQCWRAGGRVAGLLPKASRSNDFVTGRSSGVRECLSWASSQGASGSPRSGQAGWGGVGRVLGRAARPRGALRSSKGGAASSQPSHRSQRRLRSQCAALVSQGPGASSARHGVNFTPRSRAAPRDLSEAHLPQRCALWPGTPAPGRPQSVLLPHLPGRPSLHRWDTLSQALSRGCAMGACSAWQARGQRVASPASPAPSPHPGAHGRQTVWLTDPADSLLLWGCVLLKKKKLQVLRCIMKGSSFSEGKLCLGIFK